MKDSDALHELIGSLGKNEKRYFRMYCSGLSGRDSRNYELLFEAISKQKTFDAEALKKSLKSNAALVRNLSAEKNHLFNLILDSQLTYHRGQPLFRIRMLISKAQLLFEKGLTKASAKLLLSAKRLAQHYCDKELLLEILTQQMKQIVHFREVKKLKELNDEKNRIVLGILNENSYSDLLARLVEISLDTTYMRDAPQRAKLDKLMKDELLKEETCAISLQAKLLYSNIWSFYYYFTKQPTHIGDINRRMLELFESNPGYTSINLNDYLSALSNFASDAISVGNRENALLAIRKLEDFSTTYRDSLSPVVKENYTHLYLEVVSKVHAWLSDFDKIIALLPELQEMVANEKVLKSHRRQSVAFNTALALFAKKRYKESLRLLQMVEDINEEAQGSYLYFMQAMFLRFIMHDELGHYDVLEEQVSWLQQYLVRHDKLHRAEEALLGFFSALPEIASEKERRKHFAATHQQLKELMNDEFEKPFLRVLIFVPQWIEAKVDRSDFVSVRKRQLLKK